MNTDYKCLKIVHLFVAIDDVIVTSVNTYMSMMELALKKYLIKSLRENRKYGAKRLLKIFPNNNWSLDK